MRGDTAIRKMPCVSSPVSSTGPETHAKHLSLSYVFDLLKVFTEVSRRYLYDSLFQKLTEGNVGGGSNRWPSRTAEAWPDGARMEPAQSVDLP